MDYDKLVHARLQRVFCAIVSVAGAMRISKGTIRNSNKHDMPEGITPCGAHSSHGWSDELPESGCTLAISPNGTRAFVNHS